MFKKIGVILFYLNFFITNKIIAQENQNAFIKGYQYSQYRYFDSVHRTKCHDLKSFGKSYEFYVRIRIDTNCMIINYEIVEIPIINVPDYIKSYIKELVMSSNGKWVPQIKNSRKVVSDEILYRVCLHNKDQDFKQTIEDGVKLSEYFFSDEWMEYEKLKQINNIADKRYIILNY